MNRRKKRAYTIAIAIVVLSTWHLFRTYDSAEVASPAESEVPVMALSSTMLERDHGNLRITFSEDLAYRFDDTGAFLLYFETEVTQLFFNDLHDLSANAFNENMAREFFEGFINLSIENDFENGQLNHVERMVVDGQPAYIGYFDLIGGSPTFAGHDIQGFIGLFVANQAVYHFMYFAPATYYDLFVSDAYDILSGLQILEAEGTAGSSHNGLGITISEIIEQSRVDWYPVIRQFEKEDGTLVEKALSPSILLWTYQSPDINYPSTIILRFRPGFRGGFLNSLPNGIIGQIDPEILQHAVYGRDNNGDFNLFVICLDHPADFDFGQFPVTLGDFVHNDFFMSEERADDLIRLLSLGDFRGMESLVQDYIEEVGDAIEDDDTAFWILTHLEPMLGVLDLVEITYDAFEDTATIHFSGLIDISDQTHFVPSTSTRNNGLNLLIGFYQNFGQFEPFANIRLENDVTHRVSLTNERFVVLDDSNPRIIANKLLSGNTLESLLDSPPVAMRVNGANGNEPWERDLSEPEQQALAVVYQFSDTNFFRNLRFALRYDF